MLEYLYSCSHTLSLPTSQTVSLSFSLLCLELFPHILNGCLPNQAFTAGNFRTPHCVRRRSAPFLAQRCAAPGGLELAKERGGGSNLGSVPALQLGKSLPFPFFFFKQQKKAKKPLRKRRRRRQCFSQHFFLILAWEDNQIINFDYVYVLLFTPKSEKQLLSHSAYSFFPSFALAFCGSPGQISSSWGPSACIPPLCFFSYLWVVVGQRLNGNNICCTLLPSWSYSPLTTSLIFSPQSGFGHFLLLVQCGVLWSWAVVKAIPVPSVGRRRP